MHFTNEPPVIVAHGRPLYCFSISQKVVNAVMNAAKPQSASMIRHLEINNII